MRSGEIGAVGDLGKKPPVGESDRPMLKLSLAGPTAHAEREARACVEDVCRECCRGASDDA